MDGWMHGGMPHYLCAFLLYSGTVCVHFYYVQAHSAAHSAHSAARFWVEMHARSAGTQYFLFVCVGDGWMDGWMDE